MQVLFSHKLLPLGLFATKYIYFFHKVYYFQYWCDWKYRVRRRALELKASKDGDRPLPEGMLPLSAMEENIMSLIGESSVEDVVIMNDPLSEEVRIL